MIPGTFDEWKYCITEKCGIELTPDFARKRLKILQDLSMKETEVFIEHYGVPHWQNIVQWYLRVVNNT